MPLGCKWRNLDPKILEHAHGCIVGGSFGTRFNPWLLVQCVYVSLCVLACKIQMQGL